MSLDRFKRLFFPHLFLINESEESEDEKKAKQDKQILGEKDAEKPEDYLGERLKKLEALLKTKFANNWESVRKAFLDLDSDHDGFITVEDILRHFG
jgi:flagellar motility protein MotE (MotC chaperone)